MSPYMVDDGGMRTLASGLCLLRVLDQAKTARGWESTVGFGYYDTQRRELHSGLFLLYEEASDGRTDERLAARTAVFRHRLVY